jgi:membrane protein implicated in regulation of membrane protease activity
MTDLVRAAGLFVALVCFFFGTFYLLTGEWNAGVWAIISGMLLMFIRTFIVIDEDDEDDLT